MKNTRGIVAASAVALVLLPFFAGAQSVSDLQTQIQNLIVQITALQQQTTTAPPVTTTPVTNIPAGGGVSGIVSASAAPSNIVCPVFNYTLSRGQTGAAVTALQKFLVSRGFLTADSVTGFYGALTEAAVQNFQTAQGIVSSGTPAATGWGVVGKRTSATIVTVCSSGFTPPAASPASANPAACTAIALVCPTGKHDQVGANCSHTCVSGSTVSSCLLMLPPSSSCATGWQPNADVNGCTYSYTCTTTTTTATSTYQVPSAAAGTCPYYPVIGCGGIYHAQWEGNDSRGCSLGYSCVPSDTTASCPVYQPPLCTNGTLVAQGIGSNGCQLAPLCVQGISTSPTVSVSESPASVAQGSAPLTSGGTVTISWSSQNAPSGSAVALWLVKSDGTNLGRIQSGASPSGSYSWAVPGPQCDSTGSCYHQTDSDSVFYTTTGSYNIVAKLYTPSNACIGFCMIQNPVTPTYFATSQTPAFTITQ